MCAPDVKAPFDARTKCCTYIPVIPNYLAGRILQEKIEVFSAYLDRADVTPRGVSPDHDFVVAYSPKSPLFGRNIDWRCPYYLEKEGGLCGIWQHRNGRCATWFCRHLRGEVSREFWNALETLLTFVEQNLAGWCIQILDAGTPEFRAMFKPGGASNSGIWLRQQAFFQRSSILHKMQDEKTLKQFREMIWGKWFGKEEQFFCECNSLVSSLGWNDIKEICGTVVKDFEQKTIEKYLSLAMTSLPDVLRLEDFHQVELDQDNVLVWTRNPYDPVALSKKTLRLLHQINGTSLTGAAEHIPEELLRKLIDAGVLRRNSLQG